MMEKQRLSDSMMNEEVHVQIVFPLLQLQRFIRCSKSDTLKYAVNEAAAMDDFLKSFEFNKIFDAKGRRIDPESHFSDFEELDWIQLFVT